MKKYFLSVVLISSALLAFKQTTNKAAANVEQRHGLYVFLLCKPTTDFQVLGTIKKGFSISGNPKEMLDAQIKKALKEFPQANGIVYSDLDMNKANVIRIKE